MSLQIEGRENFWHLAGGLSRHSAAQLLHWSEQFPTLCAGLHLELIELEIDDGEGAAAAVDAIRLLLARCTQLELHHAPHSLAHTLYRIGMLEPGSRIRLIASREEEPYG